MSRHANYRLVTYKYLEYKLQSPCIARIIDRSKQQYRFRSPSRKKIFRTLKVKLVNSSITNNDILVLNIYTHNF